jgi:hypothetical protein
MSGFPRVTTVEETVPRYEDRLRRDPEFCLREMSRFFMKKGALYKTLRELVRRLDRARIPYAIVGAMALPVYGVVRATEDIHLLLTEDGLRRFRERFLGRGFVPAFAGATRSFRFAETGVRIDIVVTGEYPGDGRPKAVRFPDPQEACIESGGVRYVSLEKLIELKLASGMSAPHRLQDLADVLRLIPEARLPLEFAERLDPSVRETYRDLWQKAQGAP